MGDVQRGARGRRPAAAAVGLLAAMTWAMPASAADNGTVLTDGGSSRIHDRAGGGQFEQSGLGGSGAGLRMGSVHVLRSVA